MTAKLLGHVQALVDRVRLSAWALPLAVLVAGLLLLVNDMAYRGAHGQLSHVIQMGQARLATFSVMRHLAEAESSKRGFMLTGRSDYLEPFDKATAATEQQLQRQRQLLIELKESDALVLSERFERHAQAKLSELRTVLALQRSGRAEAARELMLSDIGREHMEAAQAAADQLIGQHNARIARQLDAIFGTLQLNRIAIATVTALSLLVLVLFLRQARALDALRLDREVALRAERDRLEEEVARRTAELTQLTRHLQTAREDEKRRLALELHDELGALLTAAKLDVARIRPALTRVAPELGERLTHLTDTLNSGISLKRRIIEDLRPSTLDNLGLRAALEVLCAETSERLGLPITLHCELPPLSRSVELTTFRLVQESLTNVAKHAQATQVQVNVQAADGQLKVEVLDDGRGFNPSTQPQAAHGLLGMRYRVASEGGQLALSSSLGHGTRVLAWLPVLAAAPEST